MTETLPARPGFLPKTKGGLDSKTRQLVLAIVVGIDREIDDAVVGKIPAFKPLGIREASRAVGMKIRRARDMQGTDEFCRALREATEQVRMAEEPKNLAVAIGLRDDPSLKAKERLAAASFIRGPQPLHAGVSVTVNNQSGISPGYVVMLRDPEPEPAKTIDHEAAIIPASDRGTVGESARDLDREHREMAAPRVIRP